MPKVIKGFRLFLAALTLAPLFACVFPAEPSRPFYDGQDLRLALDGRLTLSGSIDGTFVIATNGVVEVVSEDAREMVLRGAAAGETELTFTSSDGQWVETARLTVAPVAAVELDTVPPLLVGTSTSLGVRLRDEAGNGMSGAGLARITDAPEGTILSEGLGNDWVEVAPPAAGLYRVGVAVGDLLAEREVEAISVFDADIIIDARDYEDTDERWFTIEVSHAGSPISNIPRSTWTLDGVEVTSARDDQFPAELCVTILERTHCEIIE